MNVLHVIVGLNVGGAEQMLKRLVNSHVSSPDYHHVVVSLTDIGKIGQQLRDLGVDVRALGMRSFLDIPRVLWQLMRLIGSLRPDIVQTWMYHADLLGGIAAHLSGNRNVIWGVRTTDLGAGRSRATLAVRRICAILSRLVPHTIVCAAEASRQAHVGLGYESTRMVVIPNGFDMSSLVASTEATRSLREQCGFELNALVIGSLGRFNPVKNHQGFVRAAGVLARKYPLTRFLMVGRDVDHGNKELVAWIEETGVADRFVLLGERSDVPACLAAMDIYCLHSHTEGFPNVVGEAMAMGLPCVVTDVGDAALLVGETGVVVSRNDTEALIRGIEELVTMEPKARNRLGREARRRIEDEFTIDRARERFEAIYQRVAASGVKQCAA